MRTSHRSTEQSQVRVCRSSEHFILLIGLNFFTSTNSISAMKNYYISGNNSIFSSLLQSTVQVPALSDLCLCPLQYPLCDWEGVWCSPLHGAHEVTGTQPGSHQLPGGRCYLRGRIASDFYPQQSPSWGFLKGCELVQNSSQLSRNNLHPWKALKPKGSLTSRAFWKTGPDLFLSHFPRLLFYFSDSFPCTHSSNTDYISATLQSWDMKSCWVSPVQCHPKRWRESCLPDLCHHQVREDRHAVFTPLHTFFYSF